MDRTSAVKGGLGQIVKPAYWLGEVVLTLWICHTALFFLLRFLPGSPFDEEFVISPRLREQLNAKYNLSGSLFDQYLEYSLNALSGDLGYSIQHGGVTVVSIVKDTLPVTFTIGVFALPLVFILALSVVFGLYFSRNGFYQVLSTLVLAVLSSPLFLLIAAVVYFLTVVIDVLPTAFIGEWPKYVIPVLIVAIRPAFLLAQLVEARVNHEMQKNYVRTARAKGLSESVILLKHILKNSLGPVAALLGPIIASLFAGSFIVEYIYSIPGMGQEFVNSISNRDYALTMALALIYTVILVVTNSLSNWFVKWGRSS